MKLKSAWYNLLMILFDELFSITTDWSAKAYKAWEHCAAKWREANNIADPFKNN